MNIPRIPPVRRRLQRAFSLVELLVVIAIIAILAALSLGAYTYAQQKAARDRTTATIQMITSGLEQYKEKAGEYPEPANPSKMDSSSGSSGSSMRAGGAMALYQALSGDGDDNIKLTTGGGSSSDGIVDDSERANSVNATMPKSAIYPSSLKAGQSGDRWIIDGFGHPIQYEKGGKQADGSVNSNAINPTYDVWSIANVDPDQNDNSSIEAKKGNVELVKGGKKQKTPVRDAWVRNW